MKKRVLLLPLSLLAVLSCTDSRQEADVRNKYTSEADCIKDNPKAEIAQNLDDDDDFEPNKLCERINDERTTHYLGPAYPHYYYGHSGFYQGYWLGRYSSSGIVYRDGQSFTHSEISAKGGMVNTVTAAKAFASTPSGKASTSISRGGFGSYGHSSIGG